MLVGWESGRWRVGEIKKGMVLKWGGKEEGFGWENHRRRAGGRSENLDRCGNAEEKREACSGRRISKYVREERGEGRGEFRCLFSWISGYYTVATSIFAIQPFSEWRE